MSDLVAFNSILSLLRDYRVRIPAIQRNYVHGREGKREQEVREHFVDAFLSVVKGEEPEMSLDFVYGCIVDDRAVGDVVKRMIPVDGQQRLTSLWLLTVYFVRRGLVVDVDAESALDRLSRFEFDGRPLVNSFCKWLVSKSSKNSSITGSLLDSVAIEWMSDPTVAAMVRTLRCIVEKCEFADCGKACAILCGDESKLSFYFVPIEGYGSADDFYVKQNARGKSLTQWENFKGRFSASLGDENNPLRSRFDKEIEELSDRYFCLFKQVGEGESRLPDDPFMGIFVRVIDYVLRTRRELPAKADERLLDAAEWNFKKGTLPYASIDEADLKWASRLIVVPILDVIGWALSEGVSYQPLNYWDKSQKAMGVARMLFCPETANHRDFSLILFEYFKQHQHQTDQICGLERDAFRGLRLVANVLANVERHPRETDRPGAQFNRVLELREFILKSDRLYDDSVLVSSKDPQYREEVLKAGLYLSELSEDDLRMFQECESNMQGRLRMALWDFYDNERKPFPDRLRRIRVLKERFFDKWNSGDLIARQEIQFELIDALPDSMVAFDVCHSNYGKGPDRLRSWLSTRNEMSFQNLLVDGVGSAQQDLSSEAWCRNWRVVVKQLLKEPYAGSGGESDALCFDKWEIKRHSYTGRVYLFSGTNIPGAFPISDWRSDLFLMRTEDGVRVSARTNGVRMTSGCYDAHYFDAPDYRVYLYRDSVRVVPKSPDGAENANAGERVAYQGETESYLKQIERIWDK